MILNWMVASAIFAGLVYLAASLAERALAHAAQQRRGPWILAIGVSTAWPLIAGAWFWVSPPEQPIAIIRTQIGATAARAVSEQLAVASAWGPAIERGLIAGWILVSLALVFRIAAALLRMRRVVRAAEPAKVDGTSVMLSDVAGPAVCGAIRPRIVLPRWILELDAPLRAYVLRHEGEHVARGDAATVLCGALAVALVPWNPAIWAMTRRLRLVVELDCDDRVLANDESPDRYGRLLMLVAQRQAHARMHARLQPMLAESSAHLERRITSMNAPRMSRPILRAALLSVGAALVVILAFSSPVMAGITKPAPSPSRLRYANEVLKLPAARTTVQAPRTPTYRLRILDESVSVNGKAPVFVRSNTRLPRRQGQGKAPPPPPKKEFVEFTIAQAAQVAQGSQNPRYPDILRSAGVEGDVLVQFVVTQDGSVLDGSLRVLRSSHQLFTNAVAAAIPSMRYTPALVEGKPVRQLLQQSFEFRVDRPIGPAIEVVKYDTLLLKGTNKVHEGRPIRVVVPDVRKP